MKENHYISLRFEPGRGLGTIPWTPRGTINQGPQSGVATPRHSLVEPALVVAPSPTCLVSLTSKRAQSTIPPLRVGMDSDVWKSKLSVFVSAKNVNMDIHIRIRFNMDVRWMYSNPIFNITRIRHYPKYLTKIRRIRHYSYPQK
jgi:hypothetical protein